MFDDPNAISEDEWFAKYKPIINPKTGHSRFDADDLLNVEGKYIWTYSDSGEGGYVIEFGCIRTNRIFYLVSDIPREGLDWVYIANESEDEDEDEE